MALKDATDDDWKGDVRLIGTRSTCQPSAVGKKTGITRWNKFIAWIMRRPRNEPILKDYRAL
ncbi:MAG: hypothetical protein WA667_22655 [Candidatus Nitrosopolaris sp.]